ncbi:MAG: hypothetical protein EZS28_005516 [Streblomastix strix]|uniref:Uncharacterized protein n=1 Tax=Streblomastix strix TaxID=222440 RepID=A0A5J4WWN5_9EUKA|nr:MAG: hypothetical protein EZS28_005516 [Streblomastix strix]
MGCGKSKIVDSAAVQGEGTLQVQEVHFFRADAQGLPKESVAGKFNTNDKKLHARLFLTSTLTGKKARVAWIYKNFHESLSEFEIVSCDIKNTDTQTIDVSASISKDWVIGDYELRLFVDGKQIHSAAFKVVAA